jgi:hypothetical protein
MAGLVFGMVVMTATDTRAQNRREIERERQRIERQRENYARQNQRRNQQVRRNRSEVYNRADDGRVTRAGVNATVYQGYQQGLLAGQADRRANKYNRFNVYRNSGSQPNSGDPTAYAYLYRQGYLEGYEDGFRGRVRY